MSLNARDFIVIEQWAKDADTVVPPIPVSGRAYRKPGMTKTDAASGNAFDVMWESSRNNEIDFQMSGIAQQCGKLGWPVWSPLEDYVAGSFQMGTDGIAYHCKAAHGPNTENPGSPGSFIGPIDPVNSPNKHLYWESITDYIKSGINALAVFGAEPIFITTTADGQVINVRAATTSRLGVVKRATDAMAYAGTDTECYVTPSQLAGYFSGVGAVEFFAGNTTPANYLYCNGAAVSRITYAALFALIGTTYGVGNGSTTFSLPDLRGVFIRGWDNGKGYDSGRAFGSYQADADQRLTGWFSVEVQDTHLTEVSGVFPSKTAISRTTNADWDGSGATRVNFDSANQVRTAAETRPKNVALRPCIRYR